MNIGKAFVAGVIGGAVMMLIMASARAFGGADLPMLLGTLPGNGPSGAAWLAGFIILMLGAGIGGIIYGAVFEALTRKADAMTGILVSLVPMALEGLMLGLVHRGQEQSPGFFMSAHGAAGVIAFVTAHIAFGALVGWMYGPIGETATSGDLSQ